MGAAGPEAIGRLVETYLATGDIDGLLGLYEEDAVFADLDGTAVGLAEIRQAHCRFVDSGLSLTLHESVVFEAGDIALVQWSWTVVGPDGFSADGSSAEVMRRQGDGSWKFVIDNSDGPALIGRF